MLINALQSLTCDYVGCILSTCQKIKSSTLLHLCKDFCISFVLWQLKKKQTLVSLFSIIKLCT